MSRNVTLKVLNHDVLGSAYSKYIKNKNAYETVIIKRRGKRLLARPTRRWEDNI